jgi:TonB-dependent SusC/RagA subfamily outer membrane receptor
VTAALTNRLAHAAAIAILVGVPARILAAQTTDSAAPRCNPTDVVRHDGTPFCRESRPLIVVDGAPYPEVGGADIDPDQIVGVSVLKGRAASAIFGARAADGAILITTKHPPGNGCRPAPDTSATAMPPEFIQIDGPDICGKYDDYVFVVNGVLLDATRAEKCFVSVDPSAIATIDILKPAAAASVYGAKAARGAVVVTLNDGIESPCDP